MLLPAVSCNILLMSEDSEVANVFYVILCKLLLINNSFSNGQTWFNNCSYVPSYLFKNPIKSVLNLAHQRNLTRARVLSRKVGGI